MRALEVNHASITNDLNCVIEIELAQDEEVMDQGEIVMFRTQDEVRNFNLANAEQPQIDNFFRAKQAEYQQQEKVETDRFKKYQLRKDVKRTEKILNLNKQKKDKQQGLAMLQHVNKMNMNARGFDQIFKVQGKKLQTQEDFDKNYCYFLRQMKSHQNTEPFRV